MGRMRSRKRYKRITTRYEEEEKGKDAGGGGRGRCGIVGEGGEEGAVGKGSGGYPLKIVLLVEIYLSCEDVSEYPGFGQGR